MVKDKIKREKEEEREELKKRIPEITIEII
jgi:hypothetical protein